MNIKIILSLLVLCTVSLSSTKQNKSTSNYFEGKISYKAEFVRKSNKYDSINLSKAIGKFSNYFFKEGNFLIKNNDAISFMTLYQMKDNKMYTEKVWSDSVFYVDCGKPGFKILRFTITPKKEIILGINCDELKVFYENKTVTNYYNSDTLKQDPSWHNKFTFYNEDFYSQKMKSLSLKFIIERPDYVVTYTAISFAYTKLNDSIFSVPKNKPLVEEE